jgi:hypothetical protein
VRPDCTSLGEFLQKFDAALTPAALDADHLLV